MFYVYLLKSLKFDKTYIGSTNDLRRRLKEHNGGESFSTKPYKPWKLAYYEAFEYEKEARLREKNLKYNGNAVRELKKRVFLKKSGAGYTLIEILVSLTIIGLLFGFGYVSFRDFARRQSISGAAKTLQGDLRLAQQQALSGQKPESGCTTLSGISFTVVSSGFGGSYEVHAVCGGAPVDPPIKTVVLPGDIAIDSSPATFQFNVLGNGNSIPADSSAVVTLTQNGTNYTSSVTVTSGGEIK